jgi:hypothetical protein
MEKSRNSKDKGLMLSESKIHELIKEHYELLVAVGEL